MPARNFFDKPEERFESGFEGNRISDETRVCRRFKTNYHYDKLLTDHSSLLCSKLFSKKHRYRISIIKIYSTLWLVEKVLEVLEFPNLDNN